MKDYVDESIALTIDCNFGESYDKEWALKDEGKRENQIEIAKAMLRKNMELDDISEIIGLTIDEIKELQKN